MTRIMFSGLDPRLAPGMADFAKEYGFELLPGGLSVAVEPLAENGLEIERNGDTAVLRCHQPVQVFRAAGLLLEHAADPRYQTREHCYFDMNGAMLDVSQAGALPTLATVFRFLRIQAAMGLNLFMLYLEDCYEVEGEPYFGYMRPRYSQADLRAIDDYAYALGIEVIPCMQALAHLTDPLRWDAYAKVRDDESTLLVGEDATYALLRRMIAAASAPFRSRRIHLGMDEAWRLGLGEYLRRNGYQEKYDIMSRHLPRVMEIVRELGLQPMMWGDMFFRALTKDGGYYTMDEFNFPPALLASIPEEMQIIYWDYYSEAPLMDHMFGQNAKLGRDIVYAGCVRNNRSFACSHTKSVRTINDGLTLAKRHGVRETFATVWGDNCPESSLFSILLGLQLYAEHGYAETVDQGAWYDRFRFCAKCAPEAFEAMKLMDEIPALMGPDGNLAVVNTSRWLLWQDPLLGLLDANMPPYDWRGHYARLGGDFARYAAENPAFADVLSFYAAACAALREKCDLGLRLSAAYREGRAALAPLLEAGIPDAVRAVSALREAHRALWMATNKPVGFEVLDLRYGGLLARLDTAMARVRDYMEGKTGRIEELEEPRLPYNGREGLTPAYLYKDIISASRV